MPVRKNPLEERGPCIGCNKKSTPTPPPAKALNPNTDYTRLWNHVTFGCGTVVGMIEGYAALGMPNMPKEKLVVLRDCLDRVIETYQSIGDDDASDKARTTGTVPSDLPDG